MHSEHVEFPGSRAGILAGRLEWGAAPPRAWALFAHCFTCSKDVRAAVVIARALVEQGFGVLRFDFTGLGDSEGEFSRTDFSSNVSDLVAAAGWLRAAGRAPALLIGHSLGGAAVIAAAAQLPEVKAVATLGAPFEPAELIRHFSAERATIEAEGQAVVELAGRPFTIRRELLEDLREQRQAERLASLGRPLLVLHAPRDAVVSIDAAGRIFQAARHPKSFVSLDGADHLLSAPRDARYAADVIASWASRYLPRAEAEVRAGEHGEEPTVVEETGTGAYTVSVRAGRHQWLADEPRDMGGDDAGPSPYRMLEAALGACTVITLRMVAQRKQWPLERARVTVQHERLARAAEGAAEPPPRPGDRFVRRLSLEGPLDAEQRQRLLEIADRCPVHRTLGAASQIVTELAER